MKGQEKLSDYRLTVSKEDAGYIPKYGIEYDAKFFDLDSLIYMYGEEEVMRFLRGLREIKRG